LNDLVTQEVATRADLAVHAAGRVPDLHALNLPAGGVAVEKERLVLNEFLQSVSKPIVYAAGDAAAKGVVSQFEFPTL
jgi:glutathione reductase (NADPH)